MQEDRTVRFRPEERASLPESRRRKGTAEIPEEGMWLHNLHLRHGLRTPHPAGSAANPAARQRSPPPFKHPAQRQRGFKCRIKLRPELCSCRILLRCRPETFAKGLACLRANEADTIPSVPTGGPADPRVFRLPESETVLSTIRPPQQNPPYRRQSLRGMQAAIACSF